MGVDEPGGSAPESAYDESQPIAGLSPEWNSSRLNNSLSMHHGSSPANKHGHFHALYERR